MGNHVVSVVEPGWPKINKQPSANNLQSMVGGWENEDPCIIPTMLAKVMSVHYSLSERLVPMSTRLTHGSRHGGVCNSLKCNCNPTF